ncbi:hypothetical protein [Paraliobacillus ryukyuensis]|uniref:hypothetical protein n=1 Tax=Paraliobacillus ryukyuensis TaxID=200904 RepID=UPI0009A5C0E1|nr:hypothetical protein [Paraliobacillus ryukyuensis]
MKDFVVLTPVSDNRRIAMDFSDKKITAVGESVLEDEGQNCTIIRFKEILENKSFASPTQYKKEEQITVKENFDEVLRKLGIAQDE